MARYRSTNLTIEQREEIAILVNSGIPFKELVKDYGVSIHTITKISSERDIWMPAEDIAKTPQDIAKTPQDKFLFAQRVYGTLSDELQRYIEDIVLDPIASQVVLKFRQNPDKGAHDNARDFLEDIYGITIKPDEDYLDMVNRLALGVTKQHATQGTEYNSLEAAVEGIVPEVSQLEESTLTKEQEDSRDSLKSVINEILITLNEREDIIMKLKYGLCDTDTHIRIPEVILYPISSGHKYKFAEVYDFFGVTAERIRQIHDKARRKLRHPIKRKIMEDLLRERIGYVPDTN